MGTYSQSFGGRRQLLILSKRVELSRISFSSKIQVAAPECLIGSVGNQPVPSDQEQQLQVDYFDKNCFGAVIFDHFVNFNLEPNSKLR